MVQEIDAVLTLFQNNQLESALEECEKITARNPKDAEAYHLKGLIYAKMGNVMQAIKSFCLAVKLNPAQAIYHNNLSNSYKLIGDHELAIRHLNEALRIAPNYAEAYNNLGSLYYTQGRYKQAIPIFEKTIRLNPNNWEAHYNIANSFIKIDKILEAIDHYRAVLKLNSNHADAKLNLAMSYVSLSNYEDACPLLEEAVLNNPEHAELRAHLSEAYVDLGQASKAIPQYEKAVNLELGRAEWHHNLAVLYLREAKKSEALNHFSQALQYQPNNDVARHMVAALTSETGSTVASANYVASLFDQYAYYYDDHVRNSLNYQVPQLLRQAIGKLLTVHSKAGKILDLGCGTGLCSIYFRDLANFLVGVDLSVNMLAHANVLKSYDALCCCNILEAIPGYNQFFYNLIIAADVLVYIGDLESIFYICWHALSTEGLFVFTIEMLSENGSYKLQETGRFAHNIDYILDLANKFKFSVLQNDVVMLRSNIDGYLIVLRKNVNQ